MIISQENEIKSFLLDGIEEEKVQLKPDPDWEKLRMTGSEIWLDTGDIPEAEKLWSSEIKALTTNNALLNNEIQKGIYDEFIKKAKSLVSHLSLKEQVIEIAFMLNAKHGLRLASKFGVSVSVELHTDTAHDVDAIVYYGKRFHDISPDQFIVKVPYTASGLIGARKLREAGVRINFTLEFSARQNVMVALITKPNYLNIFMGRIGTYFKENELGEGFGTGERTVLSTQNWINELTRSNANRTKLIVASLSSLDQIKSIAGIDLFTIPPNLIQEARQNRIDNFASNINKDYKVELNSEAYNYYPGKFWEVSDKELKLAKYLDENCPEIANELVKIAEEAGCSDMFPRLRDNELTTIAADGKIPNHKRWAEKIAKEEIAIDTLLNIAGFYVFKNAQDELDNRIRKIIA